MKLSPALHTLSASLAVLAALTAPSATAGPSTTRLDTSTGILVDAFYTIDGDLAGIFRYPLDNLETTGLFLLGIGALILADRPSTSFYQDTIEPAVGDFQLPPIQAPEPLSFLSNESRYLVAGLAGSYALGVVFNDERAQTAAVLAGKAVTYSYLTSHLLLKSITGRQRPIPNLSSFEGDSGDFTTDPLNFGNFHGVAVNPTAYGTAMPSFHVTHYFAVARVYAGVYDNYVIPYGLAGVLDSYYGNSRSPISIAPYASSDEFGIYLSKSF